MKAFLLPVVVVATLFTCYNTAFGQTFPEPCPNHATVQNFSIPSYLGAWYEIEITNELLVSNANCAVANLSDYGNASIRKEYTLNNGRGETEYYIGFLTPEDDNSTEAKFSLTFPALGSTNMSYWVLDTDYVNYSIEWGCSYYQYMNISLHWLRFSSKDRNPSLLVRDQVHDFLTGINFNLTRLKETPQNNCIF